MSLHQSNDGAVSAASEPATGTTAAVTAPAALQTLRLSEHATNDEVKMDGMRREWNFTLTFVHEAARVCLPFAPHWEPSFIEPERIEDLNRLDRDVRHCPMTPFLRIIDFSSGPGAEVVNSPITRGNTPSAPRKPSTGLLRGLDIQHGKVVEMLYSHIPPFMTLAAYCTGSVQYVLKDPQVTSVDGQLRLSRLRIGNKLRCPHRLGGHPSFHFRYHVQLKTELNTHDVVYCIGTIVGQRGYLVTVRCSDADELESYLHHLFLPYFCNPSNISLDAGAVSYSAGPITHTLSECIQRFGELQYRDRDAAVSFSIPMHPMRLRPDFSPTKTVGVGSVACMTLELNVYESLIDDVLVAEITGMPKYKINQVLLCVEVEDTARMDYPGVMTTEEYNELKTKRLLELLQDAKLVGTPTSLQLGPRIGRSHTITFEYEPFSGPAKAIYVSTLVGNFGVTAYYLTKLGGGYFETHLYLYKQLLSRLEYHNQHSTNLTFSRFDVMNVRLTEADLHRTYLNPGHVPAVYERHLNALKESNDGYADGAEEVAVLEVDGGLGRTMSRYSNGGDESHGRSGVTDDSGKRFSVVTGGESDGAVGEEVVLPGVELEHGAGGVEDDLGSFHSQSLISVTSIPHLAQGDSESESDELANDAFMKKSPVEDSDAAMMEASLPTSSSPRRGSMPRSSIRRPSVSSHSINGDDGAGASQTGAAEDEEEAAEDTMVGEREDSASRDGTYLTPGLTREMLSGTAVQQALQEPHTHEKELGPSIHALYLSCCTDFACKPNSYLVQRLPTDPRYTDLVEELDLSSNYVGHSGFMAVLTTLEHLPCLRYVHFNSMSLDNSDIENLCQVVRSHPTLSAVHLRNNPNVTLPATKALIHLLRDNHRISTLDVHGTHLGDGVIAKIQAMAEENGRLYAPEEDCPLGTAGGAGGERLSEGISGREENSSSDMLMSNPTATSLLTENQKDSERS